MSKSSFIVIGILLAVVLIGATVTVSMVGVPFIERKPSVAEQLQPEGVLTFRDLEGNLVDLEEYKGKTLIINSWASWHPHSADDIQQLVQYADEYREHDVVVLAINRAESPITAKAYIEKVLGSPQGITFLLDETDRYYTSIGGYAMPETVFYRVDGTIAGHRRGVMQESVIRTGIEQALEEE